MTHPQLDASILGDGCYSVVVVAAAYCYTINKIMEYRATCRPRSPRDFMPRDIPVIPLRTSIEQAPEPSIARPGAKYRQARGQGKELVSSLAKVPDCARMYRLPEKRLCRMTNSESQIWLFVTFRRRLAIRMQKQSSS